MKCCQIPLCLFPEAIMPYMSKALGEYIFRFRSFLCRNTATRNVLKQYWDYMPVLSVKQRHVCIVLLKKETAPRTKRNCIQIKKASDKQRT